MGAFTYIETDTGSNANIASATAVGAYTSTGDKLVMVDVSIDQVAGNGDYVMYVTRQVGGSGSSYVILPKTTMAAASGETAISGQSGWITVRNGDVLTCYVDGLAGDTSTPDWSTRWFELAGVTAAAVADAVCDEALSGHTSAGTVGKAIADIESDADAILEDTGTTLDGLIKDVPTVSEFEARTKPAADYALEATLTAIKGSGWTNETLKAIYSSAADALSNAEKTWIDLANGGRLDLLIDSIITHLTDIKGAGWTNETLAKIVSDISAISAGSGATAQEVWEYATRVLTAGTNIDLSSLATTTHLQEVEDKVDTIDTVVDAIKTETDTHPTAAEIWANPTRTLTNATTGAVIPAAGETLEVTKDSTITINLTNLGDVSGLDDDTSGQEDKVWFTVKKVLDDADTSSVIQIHVLYPAGTNPPDTLDYINGAAATATEGTFQFTDTTAGNATITIAAGAAAALPIYAVSPLDWDVKSLDYSTGAVSVLATGKMYIYGTPTRSIA